MIFKSSVLFALLLASSTAYSAAQSEQVIPLAPENPALFTDALNQDDGARFDFFAISFLVIAALSFVRRPNNILTSPKKNDRSQRAAPAEAEVHLA